MTQNRPRVLLALNEEVRYTHLASHDLSRLDTFADWDWFPCEGGGIYDTNTDPQAAIDLSRTLPGHDALVVCLGAPTVTADMLEAAPTLKIIGEMEGDRFASRIDLDAAWARGIRTVDTTNASSYPVSEWALAMILVCLKNGGGHFRRMIAGQTGSDRTLMEGMQGVLWGRRVGLIGCGHMGRRLMKFLRAFETEIWVHDPVSCPRSYRRRWAFCRQAWKTFYPATWSSAWFPTPPQPRECWGKRSWPACGPAPSSSAFLAAR